MDITFERQKLKLFVTIQRQNGMKGENNWHSSVTNKSYTQNNYLYILFRFILELEGSQNVRVLLYEDADRPLLRGKAVIEVREKTQKIYKFVNGMSLFAK
jgi:hypothetical protein